MSEVEQKMADPVAEIAVASVEETASTTIEETAQQIETEATVEKTEDASTTEATKRECGIKFDASLLPESNDPAEIRKQVEFYFSDSNLPFDKFLWGMVTKENKPVPVKLIASFKRMRRFKDHTTIIAALKDSEFMELGGDEGDETIKRKEAFIFEQRTSKDALTSEMKCGKVRTVYDKALLTSMYAKGFGEETPTTQVDVEKLVEEYGPINSVRLRREHNTKVFKGSAFIEFANEELLKKFAALEVKPTYNGQELEWKTKEDYVKQKAEDIAAGRIKPSSKPNRRWSAFAEERQKNKQDGGRGGRGGHRDGGRGGRGGRGRGGNRGGRGGRGGFRDRNAEKNGSESVPAPAATDKNGVPQLQDIPAISTKRKAEDAGADRETKKPKEVAAST